MNADFKILCNIKEKPTFLIGGQSREVSFDELLKDENLNRIYRIQFSQAPKKNQLEKVLKAIDKKPSIGLRFYGDYSENDIDWESLINIKNLQIDLWHISKLEQLSKLTSLKSLGITKNVSSKVSLEILENLKQLETLYTSISKGIETVAKLNNLHFLSLREIKNKDLQFLSQLNKLKELWLSLGSYNNFDDLANISNLKKLSVHQVRGFDNEIANSILPKCKKINALQLQNLKNLQSLEFVAEMQDLEFIAMEGIKIIKSYEPIKRARHIKTIMGYECRPADKSLEPLISIKNIWLGDSYTKAHITNFMSKTNADYVWIRGKELKGNGKPKNPFEINIG